MDGMDGMAEQTVPQPGSMSSIVHGLSMLSMSSIRSSPSLPADQG